LNRKGREERKGLKEKLGVLCVLCGEILYEEIMTATKWLICW
jgi:hypothetical protein